MNGDRRHLAFHFASLAAGGVEKMRLVLAREFLARGHRVDLVLCRAAGEYLDQLPAGARVIDLKAPRTRHALLPLARYLRAERPDALIASLPGQNLAAIVAARLAGGTTPVFVTQHNALGPQSRSGPFGQKLVPPLYRWLLPQAAGVFAVSRGVADDLATLTGLPRDSITVLYNPACPDALPATPLADPFFMAGEPVVVAVGRLHRQKGFDMLIDAIALANATRPLRLALLGVGALHDALAQQVRQSGLAGRVAFYGFQADPLIFMRHAAVLAVSSRFEGFGNVLVEAMACGTPVVSTDCPSGPAEILENGRYGRLVPVDDAAAMAAALLASLQDPAPAAMLQARAQAFTVKAVADRYLAAIFGPAAEKSPGGAGSAA